MSKYQNYQKPSPTRLKEPHPIWRGIGCLTMLIVPAISIGISSTLVQMAPSFGLQIPAELMGPPLMPSVLFQVPGLVGLLYWIQGRNNLYAILLGALVVAVGMGGVIALVYAIIYRVVGPPRYSDVDVPMSSSKVKKYKR